MDNKNILMFLGGAVIGSLISWYFTKNKYETMATTEINEMRDFYKNKQKELSQMNKEKPPIENLIDVEIDPEEKQKYETIITTEKYDDEGRDESLKENNISFIDVAEFDSYNGYEKSNLVLYSDDILADELSDDIYLIDDSIGVEAAELLRNDRPEVIYIRNEENKTEYEVTWDNRSYGEVTGIFIKDDG